MLCAAFYPCVLLGLVGLSSGKPRQTEDNSASASPWFLCLRIADRNREQGERWQGCYKVEALILTEV